MVTGQIRQSLSGFYDVDVEGETYRTRARGNFRNSNQAPLVGDWVDFKAENKKEGYILNIHDRKNSLIRPPVANIDEAIVVTSCVEPAFSSNLLDRQLIMLESHHVKPVLYFSKGDLIPEEKVAEISSIIEAYSRIYPTFFPFGKNEDIVVKELQDTFPGKIAVVMGQTGAGKSTLLNKIMPELELQTAEISKALHRGKHTTRKVTLMPIAGGLIADTPGFSSFDLFDMSKEELPKLFPELNELSVGCKFRGCLHIKEPKCAVKAALEQGNLLQSRYKNYLQFNQLIVDQKPNYKK